MATSTADAAHTSYGPFAVAGLCSIGAGAVHAAAIGAHGEHRQAVLVFTAVALAQIGWGTVALASRRRVVAIVGIGLGAVAVGGWRLAKTRGIGFIDGLEPVEAIQWADGLAVGLAAISLVLCLRSVVARMNQRVPARSLLAASSVFVLVAAVVGMAGAGTHTHVGTHSHDTISVAGSSSSAGGHVHAAATVPPKVYDPNGPIDLSGVAGVTPGEQARAESLVVRTLADLPHFADTATAEAAGFKSIHDGMTGFEHYINWSYLTDEYDLDPDRPESLVYRVQPGVPKTLVSAMYMLSAGSKLDDAPVLGGALTQWHIHDNLCFSNDPVAPSIAGLTSVGGTCRAPTVKLDPVPMIHVWITKNECGPFAALEGVGAGQVAAGQTTACDHVHGG